jgi:hypothetical protein
MTVGQEVLKHISTVERRIRHGNDHRYILRPNLAVRIRLPLDLSAHEAQRLAAYINTLPFNS